MFKMANLHAQLKELSEKRQQYVDDAYAVLEETLGNSVGACRTYGELCNFSVHYSCGGMDRCASGFLHFIRGSRHDILR